MATGVEPSADAERPMQNLSRRTFLIAAAAVSGSALWPERAGARGWARGWVHRGATIFTWSKLAEGLHVATGEGGNVLLVAGEGGSLLIDSKNAGFGAALRREAAAIAPPVKTLVNTHHHFDHTAGNAAFTGDCEVLAHANAAPRFVANLATYKTNLGAAVRKLAKAETAEGRAVAEDITALLAKLKDTSDADAVKWWAPTRTIETSGSITVGGRTAELVHVGAGHTDNDLIVHLPKENVIHTGDLLFNKVWPYFDRPAGCNSEGWIRSLQRIVELANDTTVVVPGHGEVTDRAGVQRQIGFFHAMRQDAAQAAASGVSREDYIKRTPEAYKDYAAGDWIRPITLGGLWDEAKGVAVK